jgi:hypothetical protein
MDDAAIHAKNPNKLIRICKRTLFLSSNRNAIAEGNNLKESSSSQ